MKRLVFCLTGALICFLLSIPDIRGDVKSVGNVNQANYPITHDENGTPTVTVQFNVNRPEGQETTTECTVNPTTGGGPVTLLEQLPVQEDDTDILVNSSGFENGIANDVENPASPNDPTIPPKQPIYPNRPEQPKQPSSTPEPSTLLIVALGLLGVTPLARRLRQKK